MEAGDKRWGMYRIGICDDEIAFGNLAEKYLQEYARQEGISLDISIFLNGEEDLKFLREGMVLDIIFLDIEFGGSMDGVKVGEMLRADLANENTQIVFDKNISWDKYYTNLNNYCRCRHMEPEHFCDRIKGLANE